MTEKNNSLPIVNIDYWSDFAKELVNSSTLKLNGKILDVGTGGGACLIAAADYLGKNCQLIGIDKNENRIFQTKNKFKDMGVENVKFQIMDGNNLKFENESFDNILCGFIGFGGDYDFETNRFISRNTKMKEIFRILKIGGEAAFSTWAYQQDIEVARDLLQKYLIDKNLKKRDEIASLSISYSKETIKGFKVIMEDAGFSKIRIFLRDYQIIYKTIDEWWKVMETAAWVMRYALNHDHNKLNDLKNHSLPQGIESFRKGGVYIFQKSVIFAFGLK